MTIVQALKHKNVVTEIAANAVGERRSTWLAVLYDELIRHGVHRLWFICFVFCCRKEWADKSAKLKSAFNLDTVACEVNSKIRDDARSLFDQLTSKPSDSNDSGKGMYGAKGNSKGHPYKFLSLARRLCV